MDKDSALKEIKIDYGNELKDFLNQNPLLDENYFIEFKLKGLEQVIDAYEKVGEFFVGDDEFKYGEKSANRNLFGYYFLYREFLNLKKKNYTKNNLDNIKKVDLAELIKPTNEIANELFKFLIEIYRPEEKSSVKFVNILYYMTKDIDNEVYTFKMKQKDYSKIIKNEYGIEIKKFQKSERYFEDEKPNLNKIERAFRKSRI